MFMDIIGQITAELRLKRTQIDNTLELLAEGATVPFIARYRKEATGNLDENQIREIEKKDRSYRELEERRDTILKSIASQEKLTPELEWKIKASLNKTELEDLYLPFKPKRATRASKAREAGLEPLARWLFALREEMADIPAKASGFLAPEKGYETPEQAVQGALDILAEELSDRAEVRKWLREHAEKKGVFVSICRREYASVKTKFQMYYDFRERLDRIVSHRMLAMLRGEREKILRLKLELPEVEVLAYLESRFIRYPRSAAAELLRDTVRDSYSRLLLPATETEVRALYRDRAEQEAIRVFAENLRELLLAAPAGHKRVLGIDPGFRTGCKAVTLDAEGRFREHRAIFPHPPQEDRKKAQTELLKMLSDHRIELVAIGNGTAGRETQAFVRGIVQELPEEIRPGVVMVSEAGASVYSASQAAAQEFPDFDVTVRGAISIGRRLQDPLSELVKIDPKAIGVGQYQHDVNQKELKAALEATVESCVNLVGVDLNLASVQLLRYVAGLNETTAARIVAERDRKGAFRSRRELTDVSGIGARTFEQAAGFLRIPGSDHPLDNSAVHPERYDLVSRMAAAVGHSVEQVIGNLEAIELIANQELGETEAGSYTIADILEELKKPGRDPRDEFSYAEFSDEIQDISDLEIGMILEGKVTNVTNFGAFVDIGVHLDGLVHISQIADCFVDDPRKFVKVGQTVKVKVLQVDKELKRIGLTLKV
jgi:uncharacterized protein